MSETETKDEEFDGITKQQIRRIFRYAAYIIIGACEASMWWLAGMSGSVSIIRCLILLHVVILGTAASAFIAWLYPNAFKRRMPELDEESTEPEGDDNE